MFKLRKHLNYVTSLIYNTCLIYLIIYCIIKKCTYPVLNDVNFENILNVFGILFAHKKTVHVLSFFFKYCVIFHVCGNINEKTKIENF